MKNEKKKNNVISFPGQLSTGEREVEAILFAAAEPLEIETIEAVSYTHLTLPTKRIV